MSRAPDHATQLRAFGQGIARDVTALRARVLATVRADTTLTDEERASTVARVHNATRAALDNIAQALTAAGLQPSPPEVIEASEAP